MSEDTAQREFDKSLFAEAEPGRKGEILDAAFDVFAEKGYDAGSMRDIASRVGVSEPALYRHFPGKEAIFLSLMRAGAGRMRKEGEAIIGALRPDGLRSQMLDAMSDRRRAVRFYRPLLQTMLPAAIRNERFLAEYRATIIAPVRQRLTEKVAELDAAYSLPEDADASRESRVRALLALLVGYMVTSVVLEDSPDEAIVDAAISVMGWTEAV